MFISDLIFTKATMSCYVLILLFINLMSFVSGSRIPHHQIEETIPDEYIVTLDNDLRVRSLHHTDGAIFRAELEEAYNLKIKRESSLGSRVYLTVRGSSQHIKDMSDRSDVMRIEKNMLVHGFGVSTAETPLFSTTQVPLETSTSKESTPETENCLTQSTTVGLDTVWGLDRINQRDWDNAMTGQYEYGTQDDGSGVIAYVVDSGIRIDHVEFGNRASWGYSSIDYETNKDLNGHGTHVAGIIGANQYGVAKNVSLVAVKVLDADGSGSVDGIIDAFQWIIQTHINNGRPKSVINLSLGVAGISPTMDDAVEYMINQGIPAVIAAGNEASDACYTSPARVPSGITIGATDIYDRIAFFSNYGTCVDLFAPGHLITSTYHDSDPTKSVSGTSQAAPHVAGAVARYMSTLDHSPTPAQIAQWLIRMSTKNVLELFQGESSPNRLLYMHCYTGDGWQYGADGSASLPRISNATITLMVLFVLNVLF